MKVVIVLFVFIFTLQADTLLTHLFEQLKSTPQKEKFKIMNEIKQHIVQLKQKERLDAIKLLQEKKRLENGQPKDLAVTLESKDSLNREDIKHSESCTGELNLNADGMHQHSNEHPQHFQMHQQMHENMQHVHTIRDAQAREEMMRNHGNKNPSREPNRQAPPSKNPSIGGNR